ncbi:hypothetical protein GCM10010299_21540 [Streptomyces tanashiensis]|nr:hypothetical protein GCM10010299_21540 [Streptomyces tanashiensis]
MTDDLRQAMVHVKRARVHHRNVAQARSERHGSDRIDCEDLLIGLARVGRGVSAAVLTGVGFDSAGLAPAPVATSAEPGRP